MSDAEASNYAAEELALWEHALAEQREAEAELDNARSKRLRKRVRELLPQVSALRTRADLLLAEAIKVKCAFREMSPAWASTTQPGDVQAANE
jgi:hypothetical protein